jgi:hypothetical protein
MPWGAAIAAGATLVGSKLQSDASKKAANKAANAAGASADQLQQNYEKTEANLQPYADAGKSALYGITALNNGDYSAFKESPDYQFSLTQGLQGLDRSAAARGSLYSGGHSADITNYAEGLASQNYNNYYNKLAGLAQLGQSSATSLGSIGTGNAAQQGQFNLAGATAQGQGIYDSANATSNALSGLAGIAGNYLGSSGYSPTSSSYGTPAAQSGAGLLGGANYTGPGSTSTSWTANWNV